MTYKTDDLDMVMIEVMMNTNKGRSVTVKRIDGMWYVTSEDKK